MTLDPTGNTGGEMSSPYTLGIWRVKPGRADEFVAAWTEFADWTVEHAQGTGWGKLLRNRDNVNVFVSIGPWESLEAIEAWRQLDGWTEQVGRIRELLEAFEPATLELVVERGDTS
jgi:heme-degrading monooxygenase HmoA